MKVSPIDLRQQRFRTVFRGYDQTEVSALLAEVADDYEYALRETDRLQQELARSEALLNEHREHERNLRNTLLTAQRLADEIRAKAEQDARHLIEEAEGRVDMVLQKAQARLDDIQHQIDGLKLRRRDVETALESTISTLRNTIDFVREQDQKERDEKVLLHRPRPSEAGQAPLRSLDPGFDLPDRKSQG
jgi:cell division initiation protein